MGMLDGLLGKISEHVDIANLATKVGLTPEQAQGAVAALGQSHGEAGDTVHEAQHVFTVITKIFGYGHGHVSGLTAQQRVLTGGGNNNHRTR